VKTHDFFALIDPPENIVFVVVLIDGVPIVQHRAVPQLDSDFPSPESIVLQKTRQSQAKG
jgi:hypothetical protein